MANIYEALTGEIRELSGNRVPSPIIEESVDIDIAAEKLKRQNQRIVQSEAAIDDLVKKGRGGRAHKWKAFDLRECFGAEESVDRLDENRHTPLDVHAKPFLPTPPLTRAGEDGRFSDYSQLGNYMSRASAAEEEFQLITSRKSRITGLNAYQVRDENRTPTVTATYDKREINNVFGNDLPSPSFCQSHPGTENGQIQFCIHPNGDVSAQQWFMAQYQWINVGQYSNIRKRTEGQLASDRLRGETEGQSLQQNTLAYFHAIAKQREATVMGRPFGPKEIQACLPPVAGRFSTFTKLPLTTSPEPVRGNAAAALPGAASRPSIAVPLYHSQPAQERGKTALELSASGDTPTPIARTLRTSMNTGTEPGADGRYSNLTFGSISCLTGSTPGRDHPGQDDAVTPQPNRTLSFKTGARYLSPENSRGQGLSSAMSAFASREDGDLSAIGRSSLHDVLYGLTASASRSSGAAGRTVMHDPVNQNRILGLNRGSLENPFGGPPGDTLYDVLRGSHSSGAVTLVDQDNSRALAVNTWQSPKTERDTASIIQATVASQSDDEALTEEISPSTETLTAQVFEEEQIWDPNKHYEVDPARDTELRKWWASGDKAERHEEFYQQVLSFHDSMVEAKRPRRTNDRPGVIGPPSRTQLDAASRARARSFDECITRLLIPVVENLASYVEGPRELRRGYWAPFTDPPDSAVDKSIYGNDSFFDKPPERVGLDQSHLLSSSERRASFNSNDGWSPVKSRYR